MIKLSYHDNKGVRLLHRQIETSHFPDGTLLLKTENINFKEPIVIEWFYESDEELFTIICLAKKARNKKELYMPYCPHARQDRVQCSDDVFTLKYFADVINSLGFDSVYVLDPHSSVSEALIDNILIEDPRKYISNVIAGHFLNDIDSDNFVLCFPDAGSMKRYAGMFPNKYIYGNKMRTWETGEIIGTEIVNPFNVDLNGKTILIIDDICSKGTTFVKTAEALKTYNVGEVYLWVTHCENTILNGQVLTSGLINRVFTTNSIFTKIHEKITVFHLN